MSFKFNVNYIHDFMDKTQQQNNYIIEPILKKCYNSIKYNAKFNKSSTIYNISSGFNTPIIKTDYFIKIIENDLNENGFFTKILSNTHIFISWAKNKQNNYKQIENNVIVPKQINTNIKDDNIMFKTITYKKNKNNNFL